MSTITQTKKSLSAITLPAIPNVVLSLACGLLTVLNQTIIAGVGFQLPTAAQTAVTWGLGLFAALHISSLTGPQFSAALKLPAKVATAISLLLLVALTVAQQDLTVPASVIVIAVVQVFMGIGFEPAPLAPPSTAAAGIHTVLNRKLGRQKPKNAPAIPLGQILTGLVPKHPAAADHFAGATFGLYGNDKYGDCGPTSVANFVRLVSKALTGTEVIPTQDEVFALYKLVNPDFNPVTGAGDRGVDMQTMLELWLANPNVIAGVKPIAFAKVNVDSDAELDAAVSIFGGTLWGVNLQTAQQAQTDAVPPYWRYKRSSEWGGHAILNGKYSEATKDGEVISWAKDVNTGPEFRKKQLEEAWIIVTSWHLQHPAFQAGINLDQLKAAYASLTGKTLGV